MTITRTKGYDRIGRQVLFLLNYCHKYTIDVATNGVVITDAIKIFRAPVFVLLTICILSASIVNNSLHAS